MSLSSNPSYQALAALAASALGNPAPAIVKAILAQWQCELGNVAYPPTRNNPGNIARGFAEGVGIPFTVHFPNPQPGNPIVTYATPADGARAYAGGIRKFKRYAVARAAVARGDGRGFILGLTAAGWGTNAACALRVYGGNTGPVSTTPAPDPGPSSSSGDAGGVVLSIANARPAGTCSSVTILTPGLSGIGLYPIPRDSIGQACVECAPGYVPAIVSVGPVQTLQGFASPQDVPGQANACVKAGTKVGDRPDSSSVLPDAFAGLANALLGAFTPLLINGAVLVVVLMLAYSGLRDVLEPVSS